MACIFLYIPKGHQSRFPDLSWVRVSGVGGTEESVPLKGSAGVPAPTRLRQWRLLFCQSVYSKSFRLKDSDLAGPLFDQLVPQVWDPESIAWPCFHPVLSMSPNAYNDWVRSVVNHADHTSPLLTTHHRGAVNVQADDHVPMGGCLLGRLCTWVNASLWGWIGQRSFQINV